MDPKVPFHVRKRQKKFGRVKGSLYQYIEFEEDEIIAEDGSTVPIPATSNLPSILKKRGDAEPGEMVREDPNVLQQSVARKGFKKLKKTESKEEDLQDDDLKQEGPGEVEVPVGQAPMDVDGASGDGDERDEPNYSLTPYRAVTMLSERGFITEMDFARVERNGSIFYRCEVAGWKKSGMFGACESERKVVAREIACNEFLKQLKEEYPDGVFPKYEVFPEILINPEVFQELMQLGKEMNVPIKHQVGIKSVIENQEGVHFKYICTIEIKNKSFVGENWDSAFARAVAAKAAYEWLTKTEYPLTEYFVDDGLILNFS